jgi:hypothetical protein
MWDAAERVFRSDRDDYAPGSADPKSLVPSTPTVVLRLTNTFFLRHPDPRAPSTVLVISPAILDF